MTNIMNVEYKMIALRNLRVILDSDVTELYRVQTKRVNEAVSNNPEKFPEGHVLMLDNQEKTEFFPAITFHACGREIRDRGFLRREVREMKRIVEGR